MLLRITRVTALAELLEKNQVTLGVTKLDLMDLEMQMEDCEL